MNEIGQGLIISLKYVPQLDNVIKSYKNTNNKYLTHYYINNKLWINTVRLVNGER